MFLQKKYVVIQWPEVQDLMELDGFKDHAYLINDEHGMDEFGSSAYFIEEKWLIAKSRQGCNRQILRILQDHVDKYSDVRFLQLLIDLGIVLPEVDQYEEESKATLSRLKFSKDVKNDKIRLEKTNLIN